MDTIIDLEYYKIFYYVAKEGNLTRASEKLFISQPAISQTIKKLEEELGIILFIRNKKGVTLTKSGQKIFEKVEIALLNLLSAQTIAAEENELLKGELFIGCGSNIARRILSLPLQKFLQLYPKIEITQTEQVQTKMFEMLSKGELNMVISQKNDDIKDFPFLSLLTENYLFVIANNINENEESLKLIKLSNGSYAQHLFNEFLKTNKKNNSIIKVSGYNLAIELALQGVGITLVPQYLVKDYLENGQLKQIYCDYSLPKITFGYYYNPSLLTPATKAFIKIIDEIYKKVPNK